MEACVPHGSPWPGRWALAPPGGYTRHCSNLQTTQDFRNDPSSVHVVTRTAVAAATASYSMAHGVPGQCEMSYKSKRHIHTNRQLRTDISETELLSFLAAFSNSKFHPPQIPKECLPLFSVCHPQVPPLLKIPPWLPPYSQ